MLLLCVAQHSPPRLSFFSCCCCCCCAHFSLFVLSCSVSAAPFNLFQFECGWLIFFSYEFHPNYIINYMHWACMSVMYVCVCVCICNVHGCIKVFLVIRCYCHCIPSLNVYGVHICTRSHTYRQIMLTTVLKWIPSRGHLNWHRAKPKEASKRKNGKSVDALDGIIFGTQSNTHTHNGICRYQMKFDEKSIRQPLNEKWVCARNVWRQRKIKWLRIKKKTKKKRSERWWVTNKKQ